MFYFFVQLPCVLRCVVPHTTSGDRGSHTGARKRTATPLFHDRARWRRTATRDLLRAELLAVTLSCLRTHRRADIETVPLPIARTSDNAYAHKYFSFSISELYAGGKKHMDA